MDYGIAILSRVIDLVVLGNGDAREAGATKESTFVYILHPPRKGYAFKILATIESTFSNLLHPFGQSDFREVGATRESIFPNLLYPLRKFHAREFFASLERLLLYLCLPLWYDGLAVLDVVAVFLVSCHSSVFGWFIQGKDTNKRVK